jgi:hypothetical protein
MRSVVRSRVPKRLSKLLPRRCSQIVELRVKIGDHGANKIVVEAIRGRGRVRIHRLNSLGRIVLEQEKAFVEPKLLGSDVCEFIEQITVGG